MRCRGKVVHSMRRRRKKERTNRQKMNETMKAKERRIWKSDTKKVHCTCIQSKMKKA